LHILHLIAVNGEKLMLESKLFHILMTGWLKSYIEFFFGGGHVQYAVMYTAIYSMYNDYFFALCLLK